MSRPVTPATAAFRARVLESIDQAGGRATRLKIVEAFPEWKRPQQKRFDDMVTFRLLTKRIVNGTTYFLAGVE